MANTTEELIKTLERLKAEIEWDYSMEYQLALDQAIEIIKDKNERSGTP